MRVVHIATHFELKREIAVLIAYAKNLQLKLTGNLNYTTPGPVTLIIFGTVITTCENALTTWGDIHNHGTTQQHQDLMDAVKGLKAAINSLKNYCETTTAGNADAFLSAGWEITDVNFGSVGVFPAPTGLHIVLENHVIIPGRIHYGFNEVHGAAGYRIWTGTGAIPTELPPDASLPYQTVTHAHFDDVATSGENRWIIVGCIGTNPNTGYATMVNTIVP